MALVLVIDDDQAICDAVAVVVRRIGHEARCASTFTQGLDESRRREFALVLVDVQLPDGSGLDLLPRLREKLPCPEVIIMTSHGDPDGAELAIRNGAWDYIQKPSALENISLALTRALQYQEEKLKRAVPVPLMRDMIIGNSLPINECLDLVALAGRVRDGRLLPVVRKIDGGRAIALRPDRPRLRGAARPGRASHLRQPQGGAGGHAALRHMRAIPVACQAVPLLQYVGFLFLMGAFCLSRDSGEEKVFLCELCPGLDAAFSHTLYLLRYTVWGSSSSRFAFSSKPFKRPFCVLPDRPYFERPMDNLALVYEIR